MSWRERTKELLSLPAEAQVISIYEYSVPKGDKTHTYLRCEYIIDGKKKTKHIPRHMESVFRKIIQNKEREEVLKALDTIYALVHTLKKKELDDDLKDQVRELIEEMEKLIKEESGEV